MQNTLEKIASKTGDLPTLPQVALKVLEMLRHPKTTVRQLETVISRDQALTATVLRISNSAFYGVRREVSTLNRAIVVIGLNTLRSVVLSAATQALYRSTKSGFKEQILWEHSLAVAIAARTVASEVAHSAHDEAFVAGLLHDIGKAVLDANRRDAYQQVLERVYNEGCTFIEAERDIFGFDHTEVGALVVKRWSLTKEIEEAVRWHHSPLEAKVDPRLCAIVSLANDLCIRLGIGPEKRPDLDLGALESTGIVGLQPDDLDRMCEFVQQRLEKEKGLFSL